MIRYLNLSGDNLFCSLTCGDVPYLIENGCCEVIGVVFTRLKRQRAQIVVELAHCDPAMVMHDQLIFLSQRRKHWLVLDNLFQHAIDITVELTGLVVVFSRNQKVLVRQPHGLNQKGIAHIDRHEVGLALSTRNREDDTGKPLSIQFIPPAKQHGEDEFLPVH